VIVERTITENRSSFVLKSKSSGKTIAKGGQDLRHVVNHFNIQVDNALMILNQDLAREFLTTQDPQKKYEVSCSFLCCEGITLPGRLTYILL